MAKLKYPICPDFDDFAMCTSQPIARVASYEWCRKYLEGLEEAKKLTYDEIMTIISREFCGKY